MNGYQFNTNGTVVQCLPDAAKSLATCVADFSKVPPGSITKDSVGTAIQNTRPRTGMYSKTALTFPIDKKVSYDFTDEFDFFFVTFSGDTSSDTWIRDLQKHSLKFNVWPNFSIGPSLQLLTFKNKVNHNLLFQKQFGLEANFSFDFFNRREKEVQFKHRP